MKKSDFIYKEFSNMLKNEKIKKKIRFYFCVKSYLLLSNLCI